MSFFLSFSRLQQFIKCLRVYVLRLVASDVTLSIGLINVDAWYILVYSDSTSIVRTRLYWSQTSKIVSNKGVHDVNK